ncbi:MAG: hypothetical protein KTR31_01680 [Myxococcales bacterium]|nr:hypothetical protein [Myxococcales bacterium]
MQEDAGVGRVAVAAMMGGGVVMMLGGLAVLLVAVGLGAAFWLQNPTTALAEPQQAEQAAADDETAPPEEGGPAVASADDEPQDRDEPAPAATVRPAPTPAPGTTAAPAVVSGGMNKQAYVDKYGVSAGDEGDQERLRSCLAAWKDHPFGDQRSHQARMFQPQVRVMGLGGKEIADSAVTSYPQLILVKPSVNVMTKTTYKFLNPNGWYCLDANVTVLGRAEMHVGCTTRLANGRDGIAVAATDEARGSTAVLGKVRVFRHCNE